MTKKNLTLEDSDLFREAIGAVQTIKTDKIVLQTARPKPFPLAKQDKIDDDWREIEDDIANVEHEETLKFAVSGVQKSVLTKLRKGYFGIQAEIDLHGLTADAAKQALLNCLQRSIENGFRCIHIIHGKGYRSNEPQPILKNHINRWLRAHKEVLAFCSAPQQLGGAGAVLVLIKLKAA